MSHKKDHDQLRTKRAWYQAQWETAKELGLVDESRAQDLGLPGGTHPGVPDDQRERLKKAEDALADEGDRKAKLNLRQRED